MTGAEPRRAPGPAPGQHQDQDPLKKCAREAAQLAAADGTNQTLDAAASVSHKEHFVKHVANSSTARTTDIVRNMVKDVAIAKLQSLITVAVDLRERFKTAIEEKEIPAGFETWGNDADKWKLDVRTVLSYYFPNSSRLADFERISFGSNYLTRVLSLYSDDWRTERRKRVIDGLASAVVLLLSCVDEVRDLWPADSKLLQRNAEAAAPPSPEAVFVIHGHQFITEFHAFLRSLKLRPLEWSQARKQVGKPNPFTWEIVDYALRSAAAVVALMTPDDEARLSARLWSEKLNALEKEFLYQPRQNVLFEAGVAYGRAPERTVLVRIGSHRPMSDLAGHHILQLDNSPQSRQAVADALEVAGCAVDLSGSDWFKAGNFEL